MPLTLRIFWRKFRFQSSRFYRLLAGYFSVSGIQAIAYAALVLFPNVRGADPRVDYLPVTPETILYLILALNLFLMLRVVVQYGIEKYHVLAVILIFFLLMLFPALTAPSDKYANDKVFNLFTNSLITMLAPIFYFRHRSDLNKFLHVLAWIGFLYAVMALSSISRSGDGRLTAAQSNPITLARNASIPLLWWIVLGLSERVPPLVGFSIAVFPLIALIGSASRGPILFSLFALAVVMGRGFGRRFARKLVLTVTIGVVVFGGGLILFQSILNPKTAARMSRLFTGEYGSSEIARKEMAAKLIEAIPENPFGIGLGGFAEEFEFRDEGRTKLVYPHNIIFEVLIESGWLAGIYFLMMILWAYYRAIGDAKTVEHYAFLSLLVAFTLNALVSGDINMNRVFLSLLSICFVLPKPYTSKHRVTLVLEDGVLRPTSEPFELNR